MIGFAAPIRPWFKLFLLAATCGLAGCPGGETVERGPVSVRALTADAGEVVAPGPDAAPSDAASPSDGASPDASEACGAPRIEAWVGTSARVNEYYPDDISVEVTWQRVASVGCVDSYAPTGTASYSFAIPGALCGQSTAPGTAPAGVTDGFLTVDRTSSPATYAGRASTTWVVTWTCDYGDSSDTLTFPGGGLWFDAAGAIEGQGIAGELTVGDGRLCGKGDSSLPCTYTWSLSPVR